MVSALPSRADSRPTPDPAPPNPLLDVQLERSAERATVRVRGEVDALTAPQLARVIGQVGDATTRHAVLDLRGVTLFGGAGVTVLVDAARLSGARGATLEIIAGPAVTRVLQAAGADAVTGAVVQHAGTDTDTDAARPAAGRAHGYTHLLPLFAERRQLPAGHPRRAELREQLVTGHLPVALHIARRYHHRGEDLEDLVQVATLGLILAVDRFDPARGPDFLSFAVPTISGEVLRYFRDRARLVRIPRRIRDLQGRIYDVTADLSQRLGRAPRPDELADALGSDRNSVVQALQVQQAGRASSLDELARSDDGRSRHRTRFGASLAYLDPALELAESRYALGSLLAELPDRERRILLLRFFGDMTQRQIAERVGVSQMQVSRLLDQTLARLRRRLTAEG